MEGARRARWVQWVQPPWPPKQLLYRAGRAATAAVRRAAGLEHGAGGSGRSPPSVKGLGGRRVVAAAPTGRGGIAADALLVPPRLAADAATAAP